MITPAPSLTDRMWPSRLTWLLVASLALAACGPTNRRDDATKTPTPAATPTVTPSPTPRVTPTPPRVMAFVRVVGSAGTPFVGQILDGSGSRSVDGIVPEDFVVGTPRSFISASFTKTQEGLQTITAQIFLDGTLTAEQSTTTNFGSVSVSAPIP